MIAPISERPLHVKVAEALGYTKVKREGASWYGRPYPADQFWAGLDLKGGWYGVPRYDTDWSATGPLIKEYEIIIMPTNNERESGPWVAFQWWDREFFRYDEPDWLVLDGSGKVYAGPTPLVAVCNLLLALHAAGKLPQT